MCSNYRKMSAANVTRVEREPDTFYQILTPNPYLMGFKRIFFLVCQVNPIRRRMDSYLKEIIRRNHLQIKVFIMHGGLHPGKRKINCSSKLSIQKKSLLLLRVLESPI